MTVAVLTRGLTLDDLAARLEDREDPRVGDPTVLGDVLAYELRLGRVVCEGGRYRLVDGGLDDDVLAALRAFGDDDTNGNGRRNTVTQLPEVVPMTVAERERLAELEEVVEHGIQTFITVGLALSEIRDGRLHRQTHETFEAYCRQRWGFTDRRGRQLIDAARIGTMVPVANERQARELVPLLDEPEALREAWEEASANGKPTAATVREAVTAKTDPAQADGGSGHFQKVNGRWVELTEEEAERERAQRMSESLEESARRLAYPPKSVPVLLDHVRSHEFQVPSVHQWRRVIGFAVAAILHLEEVVERSGEGIAALLAGEGYTVSEQTPGVYVVALDDHPVATFDLTGQPWYSLRRLDAERSAWDEEAVTAPLAKESPAT